MFKEQVVVDVQKLFAILVANSIQVADHPANLLKIPIVGQPDQTIIGGDVGRKGELPATERAEITFAKGWTLARHQVHVIWGLRFHPGKVDRVLGAFISTQPMPQLGVGF